MIRWLEIRQVLLIHLSTSFVLLGIILFTSAVTYPIYHLTGSFMDFRGYLIRALLLAGSLLIIEFFTGLQMIIRVTDFTLHRYLRSNFILILSAWAIALFFELPLHLTLLKEGYSASVYRSLMIGNWILLIIWFIRCLLILKMIPKFYVVS